MAARIFSTSPMARGARSSHSKKASIVMVYMLTASNGAPINTWEYQPCVFLATASTIPNVELQSSRAQAVTIAWWVRAMKSNKKKFKMSTMSGLFEII
jgi:hypothetical protein